MPTLTAKRISKKTTTSIPQTAPLPKIFLIGMMGSGKTYWAEKLKKKLNISAYDLDSLIEMMEEKTVNELFNEDGEEYFRKAESKMLRLFAEKKQFILSCGGGTPCFHDNMKWMNKQGITIWLDEPIEKLSARLMKEKAHRPLIKDLDEVGIIQFLTKKREERLEFYQMATYTLSNGELNENALLKIIQEHA